MRENGLAKVKNCVNKYKYIHLVFSVSSRSSFLSNDKMKESLDIFFDGHLSKNETDIKNKNYFEKVIRIY